MNLNKILKTTDTGLNFKMMAIGNFTVNVKKTVSFDELLCSPTLRNGKHEYLVYLSAVNIFLSITAFLGNSLILAALHKESSLHPPSKLLYRCLATTDLCVGLVSEPLQATYLMSIYHEDWNLCRYLVVTVFIAGYTLTSVSLLTLTAIAVDRRFALCLGLGYRKVVTLKRTYVILAIFWVVSIVAAASYLIDHRITFWYGRIFTPICLAISIASYTKIFYALNRQQIQIKGHIQQKIPSQPVPLNITRYRKAVYSALWVQLALVVCHLPYGIIAISLSYTRLHNISLTYIIVWSIAVTLVFFNSSLNPFLYCWKISEVRQAVKRTIRQALWCPWR